MKKKQTLRRCAAALTAAVLGAVSIPVIAVSSESYNTWTGYMLQDSTGRYLSVLGGTEGEGVQVGFYEADGAAPYNTWYFTETNLGVTIKSALFPRRILSDRKHEGKQTGDLHKCGAV